MKSILKVIIISSAVFLISIIISSLIGAKILNFKDVFLSQTPNTDRQIFLLIRLPRVILAALTGGVLSVCGLIFQALLKNPLADPFTLGVAGGASFGAVFAILTGINFSFDFLFFEITVLPLFSFAGAVLTVILVYAISRNIKITSRYVLILSGVIINLFFSSMIMFLQFILDYNKQYIVIKWLMGGLTKVGFSNILPLAIIVFTCTGILFLKARELNLISMGDGFAQTKGVNVVFMQKFFFAFTSLLVGYAISFVGPIGFVGLIVPHAMRLIFGADHRLLLPASFFFGGALLVICDTVARVIILPAQMPVGVITSMLGAPFFIYLMAKSKKI